MFVLLVVFCTNLEARPAAATKFEMTQPDGTTFMVVQRGDEHANWIETLEGHTVIEVEDTWYYAESDGDGGIAATSILTWV